MTVKTRVENIHKYSENYFRYVSHNSSRNMKIPVDRIFFTIILRDRHLYQEIRRSPCKALVSLDSGPLVGVSHKSTNIGSFSTNPTPLLSRFRAPHTRQVKRQWLPSAKPVMVSGYLATGGNRDDR